MGAPRGNSSGPATKGNIEAAKSAAKKYIPSPKHEIGGWGSPNPIKSKKEGQKLLNTGISDGKQIYNITKGGKFVKFQPDNSPNNGYHAYEITKLSDLPQRVAKKMYSSGLIDFKTYKKLLKNNFGGK